MDTNAKDVLHADFDIFIGYHGTEDPAGSIKKAEQLFEILSYSGKTKPFLQTKINISGNFKSTPIIASHSKLFLFVANEKVTTDKNGELDSVDINEELSAFYNLQAYGTSGKARVFAYGGLDHERAARFHIMFNGAANFKESSEEDGFKKAVSAMLVWVAKSLGKPDNYFDDTIEHFFGNALNTEAAINNAIAFSAREFFHKHAKNRLGYTADALRSDIDSFSRIFKNIAQVEGTDKIRKNIDDIGAEIYEIIKNCTENVGLYGEKLILKIKSPLGSYKNRLLQYMYLYVAKTIKNILPFYIDVAMYEKIDGANWEEHLKKNISEIEEMVKASPNLSPFVIVDGIRDFACGKLWIYDILNEMLDRLKFYRVVGVDTDFTNNSVQKRIYNRLAPNTFKYFIRISSMKLDKEKESKEFIGDCIDIFGKEDPTIAQYSRDDVVKLYDTFNNFDLISLDAYWLVSILKNIKNYAPQNLIELYTSLCEDVLGAGTKNTNNAAQFAYEFEFGRDGFFNNDFFFSKEWKTIRKHRSTLDFLIARYYVNKLEELDLNYTEDIDDKLKFFDIVMPKSITRFIVQMLCGNDENQKKVLKIAKNYYDKLGLYGKSEFTLWLGRLSKKYERASLEILENLRREQIEICKNYTGDDNTIKRNNAFLLRGISVSLIYGNKAEAFTDYMHSLLHDKMANDINRGFHLEYYGDIKFSGRAGSYTLELTDDLSKGINTFRVLEMSLDKLERSNNQYTYKTVLQLFTMCSLIQARMRAGNNVLNIANYVPGCIKHINFMMSQRPFFNKLDDEIRAYFRWIKDELAKFINMCADNYRGIDISLETSAYNTFSKAKEVKRTGWVKRQIDAPENIVEHMYNCWLIGLLFLPDHSDEEGYCKDSILKMLLIHDIGETVTGDIDRATKSLNKEKYDKEEDQVVRSLLLIGTHPMVNASLADFNKEWSSWLKHSDDNAGINALIAKDIDEIQAAYQYCRYYLSHSGNFSDEDCIRWLSAVYIDSPRCALRTDIGRMISTKVILNNPEFAECITLLHNNCN